VYAMWSLLNSCVSILHDAIASTCKMEELGLEKVDGSVLVLCTSYATMIITLHACLPHAADLTSWYEVAMS
jgi:hypothetical protein